MLLPILAWKTPKGNMCMVSIGNRKEGFDVELATRTDDDCS